MPADGPKNGPGGSGGEVGEPAEGGPPSTAGIPLEGPPSNAGPPPDTDAEPLGLPEVGAPGALPAVGEPSEPVEPLGEEPSGEPPSAATVETLAPHDRAAIATRPKNVAAVSEEIRGPRANPRCMVATHPPVRAFCGAEWGQASCFFGAGSMSSPSEGIGARGPGEATHSSGGFGLVDDPSINEGERGEAGQLLPIRRREASRLRALALSWRCVSNGRAGRCRTKRTRPCRFHERFACPHLGLAAHNLLGRDASDTPCHRRG
jgi:hypothetical protein